MITRRVATRPHAHRINPASPVRVFHHGRHYHVHYDAEDLVKFVRANKPELNKKNNLGRTPFYFVINDLPKYNISHSALEKVVLLMIENGAKLHEEQFDKGSALTHLVRRHNSGNAAFLAKLLINSGRVDVNALNTDNHTPLYETTRALFEKDHFEHHRCLTELFKKIVSIKTEEYKSRSPYLDFLSHKFKTESSLKSLYLSMFLFTRYDKSTLNFYDENNCTPLDLANLLDDSFVWRNAIITLLIEKGARANKYPVPKWKCFYPTLGHFYGTQGCNSQWQFNQLLK